MSAIEEIKALEERMVKAELAPDPHFFEQVLSDDALIDGQRVKAKIVSAHIPGNGPKFTKVEMSDYQIFDHGTAVVLTCKGTYESAKWSGSLKFMRVWMKIDERWQIIAGTTLQ